MDENPRLNNYIMKKLKVEKVDLHIYEVEELACKILGIDYDEIDADEEIIDAKLMEEYQIDLYSFSDIISALLPLIDVGQSPLTDMMYKGFSESNKRWLVKTEVPKVEDGGIQE